MVNVPITHIDEDEIIKEIYTSPRPQEEKQEKIVSTDFDIRTVAIIILSLIVIGMVVGYNLQDTGLQDNIRNIQKQNADIYRCKVKIHSAEKSKSGSLNILKTKYNTMYLQ